MSMYKNRPSKMKFFGRKEFFSEILISKMDVKMNLKIIMKKYAAYPRIGFNTKSTLKQFELTSLFRQRGN